MYLKTSPLAFGSQRRPDQREGPPEVKLPESEIQERVLEMLNVVNLKGFEKRACPPCPAASSSGSPSPVLW